MLIIPAIDIIEGKVVRLTKGDYSRKNEYSISPVEQAALFYGYGFKRIHIVDLTGSKEGKISVIPILKEIKASYPIEIEFGGGIRNCDDAVKLIDSGVDKVIIGSISVTGRKEFERTVEMVSPAKIIVSADVLEDEIMIEGWKKKGGVTIYEHIAYCTGLGLKEFLCTDISRDGMLKGPSFQLYTSLQRQFPAINIIASGGISSLQDLRDLKTMNLYAAVTGKAIYENKIDLKELKEIAY